MTGRVESSVGDSRTSFFIYFGNLGEEVASSFNKLDMAVVASLDMEKVQYPSVQELDAKAHAAAKRPTAPDQFDESYRTTRLEIWAYYACVIFHPVQRDPCLAEPYQLLHRK